MCLDARAMRSYAAWKGWQTRRAAKLKRPDAPPKEWVGFGFTRAQRGIRWL